MRLSDEWPTTRRRVLRAGALLPAVAIGATGARGSTDQPRGEETLSAALDANFDGKRDLRIQRAPDPSDETPNRGQVLHATSDGERTEDYAVTLAGTAEEKLTLGDLTASSDDGTDTDRFAYDYFEGDEETGPAPDEAWLVLRKANGESDSQHVVFRTEDVETSTEAWRTRDVAPELEGSFPEEGLGQSWKQLDLEELEYRKRTENLVETFGSDARVLAAGIGRGTPTTGASVADVYYDDFVLDGEERTLEPTAERGEGQG